MTDGNGIEVQQRGCTIPLTPRLKRIIRYLLEHQVEVETTQQLTIVFDCSGNSVRVRRTEHLDTLPE